ncbi:MAG: heme-dependent peroxidase [Candidatus Dadabacteria bacterium]|nr:MAG: heme-dependent peroxidase [Candidatus Dadabacteria bacterium]
MAHDVYGLDWSVWHGLSNGERREAGKAIAQWLGEREQRDGGTAAYEVVGQKGDLMVVCYRPTPEALTEAKRSLQRTAAYPLMRPTYSYVSVIEVSLYEISAIATRRVLEQGLERGTAAFDEAYAAEMERQKERMKGRLFRPIPGHRYICFYPMSKRRGETVNWYTLALEERRAMMRRHGAIGHKYHDRVVQVIGGSVGLDDWEWSVSLHADDALAFKKLVYEMRFDPASALYAEFGPFYLGIRLDPARLERLFAGAGDV